MDTYNMSANITELQNDIAELRKMQASLAHYIGYTDENLNHFFRIALAIMVFLMQGGFAMLEAGCVRSKNTTNILFKNLLDALIAGFAYWLVGFAFAMGKGNAFIGYEHFAHHNMEMKEYSLWFFHYVFAATAATIVCGSVAERCEFIAYLIYSSVITGFIYPVLVHWTWTSQGWLAVGFQYDHHGETLNIIYRDFSGSGVVHMLSGLSAFMAAKALGPRVGRYCDVTGKPKELLGHSIVLVALGGFILLFGFLAFNSAALVTLSGENRGALMSKIVTNTIMSGCSGGLLAMVIRRVQGDGKWKFQATLNGSLAAMCAICAGVDNVYTYMAVIIGALGGVSYIFFSWFVLNKCKVDDPLDATAVHFGGGLVGVLAVAFLSEDVGILYHWNMEAVLSLGWQCVGIAAILVWTSGTCAIMFYTMKAFKILRIPMEFEVKGIDIAKHGEIAYPPEAYGDDWDEQISQDLIKLPMLSQQACDDLETGNHVQ